MTTKFKPAKKQRKPAPIIPYSDQWERMANQEARMFAPEIYPCQKCQYPVVTGYCCTHCGTSEPR